MYSGDGRSAESSRDRNVGIDMGGSGITGGIGDGMSRCLSCGGAFRVSLTSLASRLSGGGTCFVERFSSSLVYTFWLDIFLRIIAGVVIDLSLIPGLCFGSLD
jgi:hypothetical protein